MKAADEIVFSEAGVVVARSDHRVHAAFADAHRVLSFAPLRGGFRTSRAVAIVGVRNADLPIGVDPLALLADRVASLGDDVVGMMTSRSLHAVDVVSVEHAEARAFVVATAGLSNAVLVGDTPGELRGWGTINLIARLDRPVSDEALVELVSVVTEARTVAVLEAGVTSRRSDAIASGTGTDCVAVAAPVGDAAAIYAGKHTAIGHVVGAAALAACRAAIVRWKREVLG